MSYRILADGRIDRYRVAVDEYVHYERNGYLVVHDLVSQDEVEKLKEYAMDLLWENVSIPGVEPPPPDAPQEQCIQRCSRIHMLHRLDAVFERYFLQPRILDVLEALIGPAVLALQTMLFFNSPEHGGQGWHQDLYYITTYPDTPIETWLALDLAD